ncbi:MAG: tRNA (adenosine(37)-N6)-threonylcarbamoyltransferase complex transferase subunit TsaD [Anaerolineae bacterium]|nr:tRNA (adenosine(37)-N6)-threonylcarbamoyltransferase complex transferase subunit TsaD [Anaerolineae bacterium]
MTRILGIETSCDETAVAVVEDGRLILANVVASQIDLHRQYGGVFPEMASRQHILMIVPVVREALEQFGCTWSDMDAVAVTYGPGLPGSLLVGLNVAKGLAWSQSLPLVAVNHLEAHIYANWLVRPGDQMPLPPSFPAVCLVVSGGHTLLALMADHGSYRLLGQTLDDAAGEAFDKVARLLGLGYPGGPAIQEAARTGDPTAYALPRAWLGESLDFSFSGLKTAVLHLVGSTEAQAARRGRKLAAPLPAGAMKRLAIADLAASFQEAVVDVLVEKTRRAAEGYRAAEVLLAGGVAANERLRAAMRERLPIPVRIPHPSLCTDNAAITASAAYWRYLRGDLAGWDQDIQPGARLA